jgi:hypothetical protein
MCKSLDSIPVPQEKRKQKNFLSDKTHWIGLTANSGAEERASELGMVVHACNPSTRG